jgi:hypothetical protein
MTMPLSDGRASLCGGWCRPAEPALKQLPIHCSAAAAPAQRLALAPEINRGFRLRMEQCGAKGAHEVEVCSTQAGRAVGGAGWHSESMESSGSRCASSSNSSRTGHADPDESPATSAVAGASSAPPATPASSSSSSSSAAKAAPPTAACRSHCSSRRWAVTVAAGMRVSHLERSAFSRSACCARVTAT